MRRNGKKAADLPFCRTAGGADGKFTVNLPYRLLFPRACAMIEKKKGGKKPLLHFISKGTSIFLR